MTKRGKVSKETIEKIEKKPYQLSYGETWLEQPPEFTLYKFLDREGRSPFQGDAGWSLPRLVNGEWVPGEWREDQQKLITCTYGLHLFRADQITQWVRDDVRLFVAEAEGGLIDSSLGNSKFVARKVRLVREILDWRGVTYKYGQKDPDVGDDILPYYAKYRALLPKGLKRFIRDTKQESRDLISEETHRLDIQIEVNKARLQIRRYQSKIRRMTGKPPLKTSSLDTRTKRLQRRRDMLYRLGSINPIALMAYIDTGSKLIFNPKIGSLGFEAGQAASTRMEEIRAQYRPPKRTDYGDIPAEIVAVFQTNSYVFELI